MLTPRPETDLAALCNDAAEMALLGALLQSNRAYERVSEFLRAEHFASRIHGRVYEALGVLTRQGIVADAITLRQHFERCQELEAVGGYRYLVELTDSVVSLVNAEDYARVVVDLYQRREAYQAAMDLAAAVLSDGVAGKMATTAEILEAHEAALSRVVAGNSSRRIEAMRVGVTAAQAVQSTEDAWKRQALPPGVMPWGVTALDEETSGLWPGQLVIVAGRPSMGKSALALNAACAAAAAGHRVLCYSAEMTAEECAQRVIAGLSGISITAQRTGQVSAGDFEDLDAAARVMQAWPLDIVECSGWSASQIAAHARREHRAAPVVLIVVDHLHRLRLDRRFGVSEVAAIGESARECKNLALALGVPVLLAAQLNRAVETGGDIRLPQLADLRGSGDIEAEADTVIFIHRSHYYLDLSPPVRKARQTGADFDREMSDYETALAESEGKATLVIAKARQGARGTVDTTWDGVRQSFGDAWRGWR